MIHECLVIDNSNFFKNGTIRVRLKTLVANKTTLKDLSINPEESITIEGRQRYETWEDQKEFKYDDTDVRLSTCYGGAYDYGVFMLPQPNTWGIVAEVGDPDVDYTESKYIWLGAISKWNELTEDVNVPSDKLEKANGCNGGEININEEKSSFIFKQKETHISNSAEDMNSEETMKTLNWETRPTQNMVVMNSNQIWIVHNNYNDDGEQMGQSQIQLSKDGVNITYFNSEANQNAQFAMNNDGSFNIMNENRETETSNILNASENSITLSHSDPNADCGFTMGDNYSGSPECNITFKPSGSTIPTEIVMNGQSGITINSAKDISINPGPNGNITLGTGEGYILTTTAPGTWNYDNHTVTAVRTAKA